MPDVKPARFADLSFKDKAAYITALASFFLGWILLFLGMMLPPMGEISPSVITAFGTALVYTASIFGIFLYVRNNNSELYAKVMEKVNDTLEKVIKKDKEEEAEA